MLRSSETWIRSGGDAALEQRLRRAYRIMISGPQTNADGRGGVEASAAGRASARLRPCPPHPAPRRRRSTCDGGGVRASARARSRRAGRRACARRRGGRRRRTSPAARGAWTTTGRSGASPIPPATTTTSAPADVGDRPGGAERAAHAEHVAGARSRRSPRSPRRRARTVSTSGPAQRPLTEIGTSPIAEGVDHHELARRDSRRLAREPARASSVHVSARLLRASRGRRRAAGTIGPARRELSDAVAIDVEQSEPRPLQPLDEHLREALHQVVAERRVVVALAAQAAPSNAVARTSERRARRSASGTAGRATTSRRSRPPRSSRSSRAPRRARAARSRPCRDGRRRTSSAASPSRKIDLARSKRTFEAQPARSASCSRSMPAKNGTSARISSSRLAIAPPIVRADRGDLLGDVDRRPGTT